MKHFILLLLLAVSSLANAQTMFDEGNVWTYKHLGTLVAYGSPLCDASFCKFYLNGECEIDGKTYKKLWMQSASYGKQYDTEQEKREDWYSEGYVLDTSIVTFDNPMLYARVRESAGKVYVYADDYNDITGYNVYREFCEMFGNVPWYWAVKEGNEFLIYDFNIEQPNDLGITIYPYIGYKTCLIGDYFVQSIDEVVRKSSLNLFYRNGEQKYIADDYYPDPFFPEVTTTITAPAENKAQQGNAIFTIQGTRLTAPQKGLNIINGKKMLVR